MGNNHSTQFLELIELLELLADSADGQPIASRGFTVDSPAFDPARMNRVFQLINRYLNQAIRLPLRLPVGGTFEKYQQLSGKA